ncbi:MAG: hypothetical protein U5J64_08565 [Halobacteriales archaeon]|nr:hypothetical protein [Halobacteriales archaeon]
MNRGEVSLEWTSVFVLLPFVVFGILLLLLEFSFVPPFLVAMTAFFCFGVGIPIAVIYVVNEKVGAEE